jgi:phenylpyruvate tautomerase PptA (4-oxalocrotonate tautomerase family)
MPAVNVGLMENAPHRSRRNEMAEQLAETLVTITGEPSCGLTWVIVGDTPGGRLGIAARPIATEITAMHAGVPAGA